MEAYLDNAATTKVYESVANIMVKTLLEDYGNPSSLHIKGLEAERYIRNTKEIIAKHLKVEEKEIIFTSGGTESNNMAIIGSAFANKRSGNHIITSNIEHPSVYNAMSFLEEQGFRITYTPVDEYGRINIDELEKVIDEDTILVSVMYVNNEIGSVNDISEISKIIKEKNSKTLLHVDAIQGFGKYKVFPKRQGIDLLSISGHKIHGPKGIGALYVRNRVKVSPLLFGGGQENKMRSGTENIPGIAGLGQAISDIYENHTEKVEGLYKLKQGFIDGIQKLNTSIGDVYVNGIKENLTDTAPHIVSVSFKGVRSEVLLHALGEKKIYVSSGSACSTNQPDVSSTLKAIGVKQELLHSTLRFSFSFCTTLEEIDYTLQELARLVPILRRYQPH